MKLLVTGAGGYLGQGVVRQLLDDGADVIATDFSPDAIDKRATVMPGDLFSVEDPYAYFDKPDAVLHLAWRNGFVHNAPSHMEDLPKHYAFLRNMAEGGCRQIAVMGTMHEVGFFEGAIRENTPTHPENLYGISKDALRNATEVLCRQTGSLFQWLRGYYIVGNSEYGASVFSKITAAEKKGQETFPFTTGQNQCDFIKYEDFCRQTAAVVEQQDVCGIINICSGRPEKLADRVERFIRENQYRIRLEYGKFPDRPYDSKAVWGDDTKIQMIMKQRSNP